MNYKPKPFYINEGVVRLSRWIEKMESVFEISFYAENCIAKFVACTVNYTSLSWSNIHAKIIGIRIANAIY